MDSPGDSWRSDPFPGVDTAVDDNNGLALIFEVGGGDFQIVDGATFESVRWIYQSHFVGVPIRDIDKICVDLENVEVFTFIRR